MYDDAVAKWDNGDRNESFMDYVAERVCTHSGQDGNMQYVHIKIMKRHAQ